MAESMAPRKKEEPEQATIFEREARERRDDGRRNAGKRPPTRSTQGESKDKDKTVKPSSEEGISADGICNTCKQQQSVRGWGNPECVACGGVDTRCLPIDSSLFRALLRTYDPD